MRINLLITDRKMPSAPISDSVTQLQTVLLKKGNNRKKTTTFIKIVKKNNTLIVFH